MACSNPRERLARAAHRYAGMAGPFKGEAEYQVHFRYLPRSVAASFLEAAQATDEGNAGDRRFLALSQSLRVAVAIQNGVSGRLFTRICVSFSMSRSFCAKKFAGKKLRETITKVSFPLSR